MRLELRKATNIKRTEEGMPFGWRSGELIAVFNSGQAFKSYVQKNIQYLKNAIAFTGNAQLLTDANNFIAGELKHAGML